MGLTFDERRKYRFLIKVMYHMDLVDDHYRYLLFTYVSNAHDGPVT